MAVEPDPKERVQRFAHLHQHTQYSLLDGAARLKDLLKWVKTITPDDPALAMTDHGNMHGAVQFYKYALEYGVKPIIGYEAYVAQGSRFDRRSVRDVEGGYYHLTLLARSFEGYQNLCRMSSIAYLEGYYYKPRIDREVLQEHSKGIVVLSGCLGAEVPNLILGDHLVEAEERLQWYLKVFGDNYFIEIQDHGLPEDKKVNPVLRDWAARYGVGMVATNDGHYVKAEDAFAHETLLAIQTKALMSDDNRFRFPCNEFYVKTPQEMRLALSGDAWPEEVFDNSMHIAGLCDVQLPIGKNRSYQMPALPIPEGRTMAEELRVQLYKGLLRRYPAALTLGLLRRYARASLAALSPEQARGVNAQLGGAAYSADEPDLERLLLGLAFMGTLWGAVSVAGGEKFARYPALDELERVEAQAGETERLGPGLAVLRRAEYEAGVIVSMGFPDYFLIVADFINWAKAQGIYVGPGRGSGAGSIVAYALGITNIDPLAFDLLFERFLNPDRISMPDFDVDFSDTRRGEVIEYVRGKYGDDKVAAIATFGTMASKAVFRDVARVMSLPYAEADRISKLVPVRFGRSTSLEEAARTVPDLKGALQSSLEARKVFDTALSLEGLTRHASIHASGVIIGREPLTNLVPLMRDASGEGVVCQLDMNSVEDIGLLKMDFLGLRTLSFLEEAIRIVKDSRGVTLNPDEFPLDDPETFELISRGETKGVFQLEGAGITDAARKLKPRRIQDIIALSALYRPGPMENIPMYIERHHGREQVRYDEGVFNLPVSAKFLEPILRETYGIPVYQEQIMQIAARVAGYSLGQADLLRRAMGKKKLDEMAKERVKFESGAAATNAIPAEEANRLFDLLEAFANYGFNKSHSAAYAFISFQTAYIKAHFPVEFMASLLTVERRDSDKVAEYVNAARQTKTQSGESIRVQAPDINESNDDFRVLGNSIIFGLCAVKGLGDGAVEEILAARNRSGRFSSLADLCAHVSGASLNRRGLESLVRAGALDAFGAREDLLASLDDCLAFGAGQASIALEGMDALFSMNTMAPEPPLKRTPAAATPEEARERALATLRQEKDALGLYLTGHPLEHYPGMLEAGSCKAPEIAAWLARQAPASPNAAGRGRRRAVLAGMISSIARKPTKSGGMMARFDLTDDRGTVELVAFGRAYERVNEKLAEDTPALCIVEIEPDGENMRVTVEEVISYEEAQNLPSILYADLNLEDASEANLLHLDDVLSRQDGVRNAPLRLRVQDASSFEVWDLDAKADMTLEETLKRECPWLTARKGINGEALLARYSPRARPWENKHAAGSSNQPPRTRGAPEAPTRT